MPTRRIWIATRAGCEGNEDERAGDRGGRRNDQEPDRDAGPRRSAVDHPAIMSCPGHVPDTQKRPKELPVRSRRR
jgi:hypothetical protein